MGCLTEGICTGKGSFQIDEDELLTSALVLGVSATLDSVGEPPSRFLGTFLGSVQLRTRHPSLS